MRIDGSTKEELIGAIRDRFYPEYELDVVTRAYSPKKGWPRAVVEMVAEATPETKRQRFRQIVELVQKYSQQMVANNQNERFRKKQRAGVGGWLRKKHLEQEFRERTAARGRARAQQIHSDPELESKRVEKLREKWQDPEFIKSQSTKATNQLIAYWNDPPMRERLIAALTKRQNQPEVIAKLKFQMSKNNKNPVFRSHVLQGTRRYWNAYRSQISEEAQRRGIITGKEYVRDRSYLIPERQKTVPATAITPLTKLLHRERTKIIGQALQELSEWEYSVVNLVFQEETNVEQAAAILNISQETAEMLLKNALDRLSENAEILELR